MSHVDATRPALLRNFLQRRASSSPPPLDIASETVFAPSGSNTSSSAPYDPAFEVVDRVFAAKPGKDADGARYLACSDDDERPRVNYVGPTMLRCFACCVPTLDSTTTPCACTAPRSTWSNGSTWATQRAPGRLHRPCPVPRTKPRLPASVPLTPCPYPSRHARPTQQQCRPSTTGGRCVTTRYGAGGVVAALLGGAWATRGVSGGEPALDGALLEQAPKCAACR